MKEPKVIQHKDLCKIGQMLSTHGMNIFLKHIATCKKCLKKSKKHKI